MKCWKPIQYDTDDETARDINAEQIGELASENERLKAEVERLRKKDSQLMAVIENLRDGNIRLLPREDE